jgi:hypothetical protein
MYDPSIVGLGKALQQIPRADMVCSPSSVILPPPVALFQAMLVTAVVEMQIGVLAPLMVREYAGLSVSLVGMVTVAVLDPSVEGEKVKTIVELAPTAMREEGFAVITKSPASVPLPGLKAMPSRLISRALFPLFVMINPISTLPPDVMFPKSRSPPDAITVASAWLSTILGDTASALISSAAFIRGFEQLVNIANEIARATVILRMFILLPTMELVLTLRATIRPRPRPRPPVPR